MSQDTIYENEWVGVEDPSLTGDEVAEVQDTVDQLDTLEDKVENTNDVAALEAYNFAYSLINRYNQLGSNNSISLESYSGKHKKQQLLQCIRKQKNAIKEQLNVALEEFVRNAPQELSGAVDKYNGAVSKLESVVADISTTSKRKVKVDSTGVWDMFHVNGKLNKDGDKALAEETNNIEQIVNDIDTLATGLINGSDASLNYSYNLMFNKKLNIDNNGIKINTNSVKDPKKSFSTGQVVGIIIGTLFFWPGALGYAMLADKKDSEAIDNKDISKIKAICNRVEQMDDLVQKMCGIVNKLADKKETLDNTKKHVVISSCLMVIKHITEVTNGVAVLFSNLD